MEAISPTHKKNIFKPKLVLLKTGNTDRLVVQTHSDGVRNELANMSIGYQHERDHLNNGNGSYATIKDVVKDLMKWGFLIALALYTFYFVISD